MAQTSAVIATHEMFLPGESYISDHILNRKLWRLAIWAVASFFVCMLGYMVSLHWKYRIFVHEYFPSLIIGISAIYCDVLWLIRTSELCRTQLPRLTSLLPTDESRSRCMGGAAKLIYGRVRIALFAIASVALGEGTFLWLGIRMPSVRMKIAALLAISIAFTLLGVVIAVATGFWRWLYAFGRERPRIIVFHPDRMGGLLPVSEVTDWIVVMGSVLLALCAGAISRNTADRMRHACDREADAHSEAQIEFGAHLRLQRFVRPVFAQFERGGADRVDHEVDDGLGGAGRQTAAG